MLLIFTHPLPVNFLLSSPLGGLTFYLQAGEGYEYYVNANSICYILQKAKNRFKIYIIQGDRPAAKLKQDKYGTYFNASCQDAAAAEKIVDVAFGM